MHEDRTNSIYLMNADKTQLLWLGTRQQLINLTTTDLSLSSTSVKLSSSVLDLGVHIDSQLTVMVGTLPLYTPVMSVPATLTANDQVIIDLGSSKNTGTCIHQQQTLLQQSVCIESAIVCWQSCRLFRTQQRASLLEPGSSTTSLQFCVIFTGFQSGSVSVSSWL